VIEVNLLPGGKKGRSRGFTFKLPGLPTAGMPDRYILWCVTAGIGVIGYMGYTYYDAKFVQTESLAVELADGLQDSTLFSDQIARANELLARGDSIAQRVAIIQEIDVDRYVWPHLFYEVARAVPEYTWLTEVLYASQDPLKIRINGLAGSIPAITAFMAALDASAFLRGVEAVDMQQTTSIENPSDVIYEFELVATYQSPPLDELETVPLFADQTGVAPEAVPDSTGGN